MKHPAITENHLYGKAYAKGKSAKGRYTVVYVLKDLAYGRLLRRNPRHVRFNRVGLTVTKTIGKAVERSRVRRILRAGLAEAEAYATMTEGKLIVICARSAAVRAKSTDVGTELIRLFSDLGLYLATPKAPAERNAPSQSAETANAVNAGAVPATSETVLP